MNMQHIISVKPNEELERIILTKYIDEIYKED